MAMAKAQQSSNSGIDGIAELLNSLQPLFGTGKTNRTESTSANPADLGQADELIKQILEGVSPENLDAMTSDILTRAKKEFGPAVISSNAAGLRGYSDTVQTQLRNEAMARATAAAASARLEAISKANATASNLVAAKIRAGTQTRSQQSTGASPAGKALAYGSLLLKGYNEVKKRLPKDAEAQQEDADINGMSGDYNVPDQGASFPANDSSITGGTFTESGFGNNAGIPGPMTNEEIIQQALQQGDAPTGDTGTNNQTPIPDTGIPGVDFVNNAKPGDIQMGIPDSDIPGSVFQPQTTTDPSTGLTTLTTDGGDAVNSIPADSGAGNIQVADSGEIMTDAGSETAANSADLSSSTAGEGFNIGPGYVSAAINTVQGNERGAIGNVVGGAIGSYFGGSIGGAVGSTIGGAVTPEVMGNVENFWTDETDNSGTLYAMHDPLGMITSEQYSVGDKIDSISDPLGYALDSTNTVSEYETPSEILNNFFPGIDDGGSGCFITTAATKGGELDNGHSLEVLRDFRNREMQDPKGHAEISYYYAIAPKIVERINSRTDSDFIWTQIRRIYLNPAVQAYEGGMIADTRRIYHEMMHWLMDRTGVQ